MILYGRDAAAMFLGLQRMDAATVFLGLHRMDIAKEGCWQLCFWDFTGVMLQLCFWDYKGGCCSCVSKTPRRNAAAEFL